MFTPKQITYVYYVRRHEHNFLYRRAQEILKVGNTSTFLRVCYQIASNCYNDNVYCISNKSNYDGGCCWNGVWIQFFVTEFIQTCRDAVTWKLYSIQWHTVLKCLSAVFGNLFVSTNYQLYSRWSNMHLITYCWMFFFQDIE